MKFRILHMKANKALEFKNQGNYYFKDGDYEKALQFYGKAIEIDPDYRDAWNNIYITLIKLDRTDEARKCKEIINRIESKSETSFKKVADRPHKRLKQALAVVIVILLALSIALASLSILGWVSYQSVLPVSPEQYVSRLIDYFISQFVELMKPS